MAELLGISNKGMDSLGVQWGECIAVIWKWRRHRRKGGKRCSNGSSGAHRLVIVGLQAVYPSDNLMDEAFHESNEKVCNLDYPRDNSIFLKHVSLEGVTEGIPQHVLDSVSINRMNLGWHSDTK